MRIPERPPDWRDVLQKRGPTGLPEILARVRGSTYKGRYLHWDKLRRLKPPEPLSSEEWWLGLKLSRQASSRPVPLTDINGRTFWYGLPDQAEELLHRIDQGAGGLVGMDEQITNPATRDRYIVSSLVEEAIRSSQLEGAVTTRQIATEMIRSSRPPRDRSEQMILNNFRTMQRIHELKTKELSPALVLELQKLVTANAMDDPSASGRLRSSSESVQVVDMYNEVHHRPPPADQLQDRLATMCDFANGKTPDGFVHPVVRAIILHFWLAYDHPFVDGNGRCARALFYWSTLRQGYWLCEYISISQVIHRAIARYYRAFLYTETDDNDLSYFVLYHLDVIWKAIQELHEYIKRKAEQLQAAERLVRGAAGLNHRQCALIGHALRHSDARYSIESHRSSHNVVYQTARTDLLDMATKGLLVADKHGRTWYFRPARNLEEKLRELGR